LKDQRQVARNGDTGLFEFDHHGGEVNNRMPPGNCAGIAVRFDHDLR